MIKKYGPLGSPHLANLTDDIPELKNHAKERPEIVSRLTEHHQSWFRKVMPVR
ncbi:MAG: hypothetical protein AAF539_14510 [Planctomycetota bacterium]